jgi:hypothetical protein
MSAGQAPLETTGRTRLYDALKELCKQYSLIAVYALAHHSQSRLSVC